MSSNPSPASPEPRRRLLEEAARILDEEGPSALSARRLAAAVGTSTMAVYTHFGSMAGVVDGVATEGFRRLVAHVDAVGATDDVLADLRRMAGAYRDNALENRHLYGVMFGAIRVGGFHGRGADKEVAAAAFDQIASGIQRAMDAGVLEAGDARAVAAQFWSALHGYVMLELAGMDRVVDDSEHTVLWPMLAHLLAALAPPSRSPRSVTIGGTGVMLLGCLAALVVFVLLARVLRGPLGPVTAVAIAGFGWTVVCIGILTLIPAEWGIGVVPVEDAQTSCSLDYGGPAPDGFWILPGSQRLLNMAVFVPAGALWVLAASRWRTRWVLAPLGIAALAVYSLLIESAQLAAARIGRACDVTDVVDNVAGAVLGGLVGVLLALVLRPWRESRPVVGARR